MVFDRGASQAMATFGTCTWEFNNGTWTIKASNCVAGHVCAQGLTAAQSSPGGTTLTDSAFRDGLNQARKLATGNSIDVISKNLKLANGTTYEMDCV
jgi:hypothetical protein